MGMNFMHLPKSKQFRITTRFYDPAKEAMREREERIRREMEQEHNSNENLSFSVGIKGQFRKANKNMNSKTVQEARKKSNMRLMYILIALIALIYFLLK